MNPRRHLTHLADHIRRAWADADTRLANALNPDDDRTDDE